MPNLKVGITLALGAAGGGGGGGAPAGGAFSWR
jgi:hypothetical protein